MGWLSDAWDNVTGFINDYIWEPVVTFFTDAIDDMKYYVRMVRHEMNQKFAKWLKNDIFFMAFVAALVLLVIFSGKIKAFFKLTKFYTLTQDLVARIKEGTITLRRLNLIIDLKLLHQISKVFFENYRETMLAFSEAVSQLCSELGEGSAYLHAYFASLRGIKMGSAAILGLPLEAAEASWYNDTTEFLEKANFHFRLYAKDPGRLYYDFVDWQLRNAYDTYRDASQVQVDEIRNNHERVTEVDNGLIQVTENLEMFIANMPAEVEAAFREQIGPFQDELNRIAETFHTQFMPMLNEIVAAFEEHYQYQTLLNDKAQENMMRYDGIFSNPWTMGEQEQANVGGSLGYLLNKGTQEDSETIDSVLSEHRNRYAGITSEYIRQLVRIPVLEIEAPGVFHVKPERTVNIPSPFVGDY